MTRERKRIARRPGRHAAAGERKPAPDAGGRRGGRPAPGLPTREEVIRFIHDSATPVGKREIARAFGVRGGDRIAFKELLREIEAEGLVDRGRKRRLAEPGALPEVTVLQVTGHDPDGEVLARPVNLPADVAPPVIYMAPERHGTPALAPGDRVLARLRRIDGGAYEGRTIRYLGKLPARVLGVYREGRGGTGQVVPTDRRARHGYDIGKADSHGARDGDLVWVEPIGARAVARQARVLERLGSMGDPKTVSLVAIASRDIPVEFPPEALRQAERARPAPLGDRRDLREVPLVTIDGEDARDFDDAVFAEPDGDARNPGGWHLIVAIADVAWYVRPGDALDRAAERRGNSVYFPDRVVPMLPEALSNGWCSLRPAEERPVLAVDLWIDRDGKLLRHRFSRALMRSAARLTYTRVQRARDGQPDEETGPLLDRVIQPLYGAYEALAGARRARGAIDLDLPERKIVLSPEGKVARIEPRERLDSHKLIEEFMIAANVAAAEALEARRQPCMYRVHEPPDAVRVEALREFLGTLGIRMPAGPRVHPKDFNHVLARIAGTPQARLVNEMILRSQSQADYRPENAGHFGLALARYAHFTSPIRRYSDLLVHRGLIRAFGFGEGGLPDGAGEDFQRIGEHISATERQAAAAERDANDRYVAAYLADQVGADFTGRINGVTRFGLFITLDETGADGLVPIRSLGSDYFDHDEARHALFGRSTGVAYYLGDRVRVRLREAEMVTGGLVFELLEVLESAALPSPVKARRGKTAREGAPRGKAAAKGKAKRKKAAAKPARRRR